LKTPKIIFLGFLDFSKVKFFFSSLTGLTLKGYTHKWTFGKVQFVYLPTNFMESQVYENGTFSSCTPNKSPFFGLKFFSDFSETGVLRIQTKQESVFFKT
jgi:hypothetical protein